MSEEYGGYVGAFAPPGQLPPFIALGVVTRLGSERIRLTRDGLEVATLSSFQANDLADLLRTAVGHADEVPLKVGDIVKNEADYAALPDYALVQLYDGVAPWVKHGGRWFAVGGGNYRGASDADLVPDGRRIISLPHENGDQS